MSKTPQTDKQPLVTVTCRHMELTDAIRDYAEKKVESLSLDYPRIIEAKVILDVQKENQIAEMILFCANHITIQATTTHEDLYAAIDGTISKIARRMRKHKTRLLKHSRPRNVSIRHLPEHVFTAGALGDDGDEAEPGVIAEGHLPDLEPDRVHEEPYTVQPLYREEAMMQLEMNDTPFVLFSNAETGRLAVMYKRPDGDFGLVEPEL